MFSNAKHDDNCTGILGRQVCCLKKIQLETLIKPALFQLKPSLLDFSCCFCNFNCVNLVGNSDFTVETRFGIESETPGKEAFSYATFFLKFAIILVLLCFFYFNRTYMTFTF